MKELKWGETPWDDLSKEELLREVQRMYTAVISLNGALSILRRGDISSFWSISGGGGKAMERTREILEPLYKKFGEGSIYRAFFRYANDLLFTPELGFSWTACDGCNVLLGDEKDALLGQPCQNCSREGRNFIRRRLEWRDLNRVGEKS